MELKNIVFIFFYFLVPYAIGMNTKPNIGLCLGIVIPYLFVVAFIHYKVSRW